MIYAIIAVLVLIADQWLKYWVTVNITLETGSQALIPGAVKLVNIHNSGAAFGILDNVPFARWVLLGLAVAMCIVIIILIAKRVFPSKFATWCMVLFMAGALGNCIDRSIYGYVVDMFKLEFVSFAVFNVADIFLTVSCLLFIIYLFVGGKDEEELSEALEDKPSRKSRRKKVASAEDVSEELANTEDDVWNNFKAALHPADEEEEEEPEVEPKAPRARKSALKASAKPEVKEEPMPEIKEESSPSVKEEAPAKPTSEADSKVDAKSASEASIENISLEDILREFGS